MIEFRLTYAETAARVADVIGAILLSEGWGQQSHRLSDATFVEAREPVRHIFDAYEGREGEEWLGVLETMVIEEMRLSGPSFAATPSTINAIVVRIGSHPNVRLEAVMNLRQSRQPVSS
jgi:hypothetical protein